MPILTFPAKVERGPFLLHFLNQPIANTRVGLPQQTIGRLWRWERPILQIKMHINSAAWILGSSDHLQMRFFLGAYSQLWVAIMHILPCVNATQGNRPTTVHCVAVHSFCKASQCTNTSPLNCIVLQYTAGVLWCSGWGKNVQIHFCLCFKAQAAHSFEKAALIQSTVTRATMHIKAPERSWEMWMSSQSNCRLCIFISYAELHRLMIRFLYVLPFTAPGWYFTLSSCTITEEAYLEHVWTLPEPLVLL